MDRGIFRLEQAVSQAWKTATWRAAFPGLPANLGVTFTKSPMIRQEKRSFFEHIQLTGVILRFEVSDSS
jgi:hypothetical protein